MNVQQLLRNYAAVYETAAFLDGDPSWFMHQVGERTESTDGAGLRSGGVVRSGSIENQETTAFVASCLSYGNRKQFMPKIQYLLDLADGDMHGGISSGAFRGERLGAGKAVDAATASNAAAFPDDDACFYRLYTNHTMYVLFTALQEMFDSYGSLGGFIRTRLGMRNVAAINNIAAVNGNAAINDIAAVNNNAAINDNAAMNDNAAVNSDAATNGSLPSGGKAEAIDAVRALTSYFAVRGCAAVPKDSRSACKRVCMFLRWMVRDGSPVDLGLWADCIDKRTLIMPMDTHVLQQANRLGLISAKTATMSTALRLTERLRHIFPDDPTRADYALFGYGVNQK